MIFIPAGAKVGLGLSDIIASSSLSGGNHLCSGIDCRVKSASSGARFAALYAEHIWIRDPFEHFSHHSVDDFDYVQDALAAIASFTEWKPLLVAGVAGHLAPICSKCATKRITENKLLNTSVQELTRDLIDQLVDVGQAIVRRDEDGKIVIEMNIPSRYTGHRYAISHPEGAIKRRLARFLGGRSTRKVPKHGDTASDAFYTVWRPTLDEALMQAMHRGLSGATYASNLQVDLEIAARARADTKEIQNAANLVGVIKHTVPIVEGIPVATVLRLRQEDEGSFQLYRSRIAALRSEINDEKTRRDAAEQLRTEFATLATKIGSRKKSLWGGVRDQVKIATGTVGAGVGLWLSHILTPTWSAIAAAAGGLTVLQKIAAETLSGIRPSSDEMTHPLYFLWKVKKSGQRGL